MTRFKRFQYHIVRQKCQEVRKFPSVIPWPTLLQMDNLFQPSKKLLHWSIVNKHKIWALLKSDIEG